MAARQQLIFRLNGLAAADGIGARLIFEHHHVARLAHGGIWLGRHDQAERLQFRGDPQFGLIRTAGRISPRFLACPSGVMAHST